MVLWQFRHFIERKTSSYPVYFLDYYGSDSEARSMVHDENISSKTQLKKRDQEQPSGEKYNEVVLNPYTVLYRRFVMWIFSLAIFAGQFHIRTFLYWRFGIQDRVLDRLRYIPFVLLVGSTYLLAYTWFPNTWGWWI